MPKFKPATHVIFDLDGLLIDTESMNKQILKDISQMFNKEMTPQIKQKFWGRTEADSINIFLKEMGIPLSFNETKKLINGKEKEIIPTIDLMPGAEKLICHFAENNIPLALATNSSYEAIEFKLANYKHIRDCFHHVVSGENDPEVKRGKPAPDVYIAAAARFIEQPMTEECLVFEDSPAGVTAATCAGMQVVMVPDPDLDKEQTKNATLVLKSLCDFKPECFCLPPFTE